MIFAERAVQFEPDTFILSAQSDEIGCRAPENRAGRRNIHVAFQLIIHRLIKDGFVLEVHVLRMSNRGRDQYADESCREN